MAIPLLQTTRSDGISTVILPEGSIFAGYDAAIPFVTAQVSEPPTYLLCGVGGAFLGYKQNDFPATSTL